MKMFDEELLLFGLKRSGNAAITNFLQHLGEKNIYAYDHMAQLRIRKTFRVWQKINVGRYRDYLHTIEQMDLRDVAENLNIYEKEKKKFSLEIGSNDFSNIQKNLLVLRSPHNYLASLFASGLRHRDKHIENFQYFWKQYADETLSKTNYLGDSKLIILFDKWFQSEDYRKRIAFLLGAEYTDRTSKGIEGVIRVGSSFDGRDYHGKAQKMKVLDRWKNFKDNDLYREILLGDEDIVEKTKEIFHIDLISLF